jgi:hypothetical protein
VTLAVASVGFLMVSLDVTIVNVALPHPDTEMPQTRAAKVSRLVASPTATLVVVDREREFAPRIS